MCDVTYSSLAVTKSQATTSLSRSTPAALSAARIAGMRAACFCDIASLGALPSAIDAKSGGGVGSAPAVVLIDVVIATAYECDGRRRASGRIMSPWRSSSWRTVRSTSEKCATSFFVSMSTRIVAADGSRLFAGSSGATSEATSIRSLKYASTGVPGEKPSALLIRVGSSRPVPALSGRTSDVSARRTPVFVVASGVV